MKTQRDARGRRKGKRPGNNSQAPEISPKLAPEIPQQMTLGQPRQKGSLEKKASPPRRRIAQSAPNEASKADDLFRPDDLPRPDGFSRQDRNTKQDDNTKRNDSAKPPLGNGQVPLGNTHVFANAQFPSAKAKSDEGNNHHQAGGTLLGNTLPGDTSQHSSGNPGALPHPGTLHHPGDRKFGRVLIGPAGWSYSDWSGILYPTSRPRDFHEASFLAEYFDTIEINTSFYQPVRPTHAELWVQRVESNPRFLYTAKLWRKFTHEEGATAEDEQAVREGFDVLRSAHRLGAVLLQFPFSFHYTPANLDRLKKMLDSFGDYPLVVEVRHASWSAPEFLEFLARRGTGICNIDQPVIGKSIKPTERTTGSIGYVRLHGRRYDTWFSDDPETPSHERYNYLYSEEELEPWAARIRHVSAHAETTFVVTNNHFEAKGVVNALQLINMLTGEKVKVPEELRHHYPQLESIADAPAEEPTLFPIPPK
jgi:uncharacterized protein YecE (DUF72 family)